MINLTRQLFLWLLILIMTPALSQSDQSTLTINQPAPPIKVEAWLKGQPVKEFKKGMIYVVDFGFISCGPCRAAIPHITELARKYKGQLEVFSVFVYENSKNKPGKAYVQKVKNFIDKQGDKMGYSVAVDDEQQTMARTWYEPAARGKFLAFPAIFVVGETGKIAWIGHASELEHVIEDIVQRRFDPQAGVSMENNYKDVLRRIHLATKGKEFKTAIHLMDSLITSNPNNKSIYVLKFQTLLDQDMHLALDYGRQLLSDACHNDESILYRMADAIISKNYIKVYRDFNELSDLVIYLTDRALILSTSDLVSSKLMLSQAQAYANKNLFSYAIQKQELSIEYFNKDSTIDTEVAKVENKVMLEVLESYKKQAARHNSGL